MSFAKLLYLSLFLLWILLKAQKLTEGKNGIQWRSTCALLGTEDPAHHPESELELKTPMISVFPSPSHSELLCPCPSLHWSPGPGSTRGAGCATTLQDQHRRWSRVSVALSSLFFLRVFQQVSGRFWREGAQNLAQSLCPRQPLPLRSLWKWGRAGVQGE